MNSEALLRTPLYSAHVELGARMVPFAGWEMPIQYRSILEEARAVRGSMGMFDISHMGRFEITGEGALALIQCCATNDASTLRPGDAQYSLLTNENGGILDDIIVYRTCASTYNVVVNASNCSTDYTWLTDHTASASIEDQTSQTAMIALQGPAAPTAAAKLADCDILALGRFQHMRGAIAGVPCSIFRTGYTGDDGVELVMSSEAARTVWETLREVGAVPCGLGARDALRIEAGLPLYGNEIDEQTTPVEAGLMWAVKLDKSPFLGRDAIAARKAAGPDRRLVGLTFHDRVIPRKGYNLHDGEILVGTVTSGVFSPTVNYSVGMAYVKPPYHRVGTVLSMPVRGVNYPATVVAKKDLLS